MKHFLVIVDIQKDFVDGALGTKEAQAMVPLAAETIEKFQGDIFVTYDTHFENYLSTAEGKKLQVAHCIKGTPGWELDAAIAKALQDEFGEGYADAAESLKAAQRRVQERKAKKPERSRKMGNRRKSV